MNIEQLRNKAERNKKMAGDYVTFAILGIFIPNMLENLYAVGMLSYWIRSNPKQYADYYFSPVVQTIENGAFLVLVTASLVEVGLYQLRERGVLKEMARLGEEQKSRES